MVHQVVVHQRAHLHQFDRNTGSGDVIVGGSAAHRSRSDRQRRPQPLAAAGHHPNARLDQLVEGPVPAKHVDHRRLEIEIATSDGTAAQIACQGPWAEFTVVAGRLRSYPTVSLPGERLPRRRRTLLVTAPHPSDGVRYRPPPSTDASKSGQSVS
jgi:hypothetical protein